MDFMELAAARYSVRKFTDAPLEREKLDTILEAGRLAPTARNLQPQRVYVLRSAEALETADRLTGCRYGAGTVLLVCYDETRAWHNAQRPGYTSGEVDASIVTTHMMLAAWELGVGSVWVGHFNDEAVSAAFGLPAHIKPVAFLPLGYAAIGPKESQHNSYRPREETIEER
jgi:nitroreductase